MGNDSKLVCCQGVMNSLCFYTTRDKQSVAVVDPESNLSLNIIKSKINIIACAPQEQYNS